VAGKPNAMRTTSPAGASARSSPRTLQLGQDKPVTAPIEDELDAYLAKALKNPIFAAAYKRACRRVTGFNVTRELAWFRIRGHGLWVKWGDRADLFTTRKYAHYIGRLRWKVLRPDD